MRSTQPLPKTVKLFGWASLLNDTASEAVFPLLPQFLIKVLGASTVELGWIEGLADSTASLVKLWSGAWSDRLQQRKRFIVFGYALPALLRPVLAIATAPWHVFAVRILDRLGKGLRTTPRDAMIADVTTSENRGRAFGFHRAMDHIGAAIGPLLAAAFLVWRPGELRWLFGLAVVPGVLAYLVLAIGLSDQPARATAKERLTLSLQPFARDFRVLLIAIVVFALGNASDAFLLLRAGELGVSTPMLPILWLAFHVVKSGGNLVAGQVVDRCGPRFLLPIGWLLYAVVYLAFGWASTAWQAWALFLTYGLFYALTEPAEKTLVASMSPTGARGLAFGWFHFATGVAALPASVLFGWWYERVGPRAAFVWGASLAALAAVILLVSISQPRTKAPQ